MKQRTGSKLGKEYVKAIYCHPAYLKSRHNKLKMCLKGQAKPNAWMFGQNRAGFLAEGGWAWQNVWEVRGLIWKTSPSWLLHLLETVRPDLPTTPSKFFRSPAQWVFLHLLNYAHSITNTKQVALSFPQAHLQPHFHVSLLTLLLRALTYKTTQPAWKADLPFTQDWTATPHFYWNPDTRMPSWPDSKHEHEPSCPSNPHHSLHPSSGLLLWQK